MTVSDFHVMIIGAGATGLLIAQGLKKAGISFTVYERYDEQKYIERSGKWTMALHWSIAHIEACLPSELFGKLQSATTNPWEEPDPEIAQAIPLLNGRTGDVLAKMPMPNPKRVVRGKLCNLFQTGIDVNFGMELTDLHVDDGGVTASFNGGKTIKRGDVLIGADGTRSVVRGLLVEKEAAQLTKANIMVLNAFPTFTREQALFIRSKIHPILQLAPHPDQHTNVFVTVSDVVDPEKPETWVFHFILSIWATDDPPADEEERRRLFKSYLANYCEPYRSVAAWMDDNTPVGGEKYHFWERITPWQNHCGRITLAGDAAHPMVPFRAQGLNNAVEDANLYVDAIRAILFESKDLKESIDAYDHATYTRGKRDIDLSAEQMYSYHHWDKIMESPMLKTGYKKSE